MCLSIYSFIYFLYQFTFFQIYLLFIVGTPAPPLIKKGVGGGEVGSRTFQKLSHLGGIRNFLLERGDKPEKGVLMKK